MSVVRKTTVAKKGRLLLSGVLCLMAAAPLRAQSPKAGQGATVRKPGESNSRATSTGESEKRGEAILRVKEELGRQRKTLGDEHLEVALSLSKLGVLLGDDGKPAEARAAFEESLKIRQKAGDGESNSAASTHNQLGIALKALGEYPAAKTQFERALTIWDRQSDKDRSGTAATLHNLANLLHEQGDDAAARPLIERALRIVQKERGDKHLETANVLMTLGLILQELGDPAGARPHIEQALTIRMDLLGKEHRDVGYALNNYGTVLLSLGRSEDAETVLGFALQVQTAAFGAEHPEAATVIHNLACLRESRGDVKAARDDMETALRIRTKALGEKHPDTASSLASLSALLVNIGDYEAAKPIIKRAIAVQRSTLGNDHPKTIDSYYSLVISEIGSGDLAAGLASADQTRRAARRYVARSLPNLSDAEQLTWITQKDHAAFHGALTLGGGFQNLPGVLELGAGWVLNGKSLATASLAERNLLLRDARDETSRKIVTQLLDVRKRLVTVAMSAPTPGGGKSRLATINELTAEEQKLSREFSATAGRGEDRDDPWIEVDTVRSALDADEVLIEIARHDVVNLSTETGTEVPWLPAHYSAWVIPPAGKNSIQYVDLGLADDVEALLAEIRTKTIEAAKIDSLLRLQGEAVAVEALNGTLRNAGKQIWDPLAQRIPKGTKKLVLSLDGDLWLLPWAMLPVGKDRLLLEDYSIRLVASGREVVRKSAVAQIVTAPLLFADPDYDLSGEAVQESLKIVLPDYKLDDTVRGFTSKVGLPSVARLPNTRLESQFVAPNIEKIAGMAPRTFSDKSALESVVKQSSHPRILMLSTHGFFLADQATKPQDWRSTTAGTRAAKPEGIGQELENPLLRCGLLFAGCNARQQAGGDDGVLTGLEITGLDLRGTELVVLSACETGLGKVNHGEGVSGLRQAFQLAGAEAVVSTLWQVPDRDSALLMNDFFANLAAGQPKAEALRTAQLARIHARRERYGAAHPFFWAAWTVTGR